MCQQHPQFLTAYRLHVHRTVKPSPHHLRNTARIVAVRLVDLRLQHRLHVPRLNADHRQSCFGKSAEQPLQQRSSFQPNSFEVVGGILQHANYASGSLATFTSRTILPAPSTMQMLVSLTETSSPAKWVHAA